MNRKISFVMQSVRIRTGVAFLCGFVSPLTIWPLNRFDPFAGFHPTENWVIFPALFIIVSFALILALALALPWRQYTSLRSIWRHALGVVMLFAAALYGSAWCCRNHVCMAGHGCHGMTPVGRILDLTWVLGLLLAVAWAALVKSTVSIPTGFIAGFVISYRFLFGSMGGMFPIPL